MLDLHLIRIDGDTQSREKIDEAVVAEYAEALKAGAQFPPVKVFFDGVDRWLADGFHRYHGARAAGLTSIYEDITPGTREEAQLYSFGANGSHGLRRTNADKRRAVEGALKHPVSSNWSDNKIAKHCGVSQPFVGSMRAALITVIGEEDPQKQRAYTTKHGAEAVMATANIGRTPAAELDQAGEPPVARPPASAPLTPALGPEPASQPPSAPAPPAEATPPECSELDAARDQIADLHAALALANLGDVPEADRSQAAELIEHLQGEVKGLSAQLRTVTSSRDFLMQENTQMKQQLAFQRREIDRLKAGAA